MQVFIFYYFFFSAEVSVAILAPDFSVSENAQSLLISIVLSGYISRDVVVNLRSADGTAVCKLSSSNK